MLKMVDGTGIIGVDMICPLGVSTPQPPNYDRVEMEGTGMLVLPNSLDAPLERLELGGKTTQMSTRGVNLFDVSKVVPNNNVIRNGDGSIKVIADESNNCFAANTPNTLKDYCPLLIVGQTYTLSANTAATTKQIYLKESGAVWTYGESVQITKEMLDSVVLFYSDVNKTGVISNIQIEKGSTATAYEPYTGNKTSPSPEYEQKIENAGKLNADTQKYEVVVKAIGKNLFDIEKAKNTQNWFTSVQSGYSDFEIYVGKGNTVTISYTDTLEAGLGFYAGIVYKKDGAVSAWLYNSSNISTNTKNVTFTAIEDSVYIRCSTNDISKFTDSIKTLQVEIGKTQTNFIPGKEQSITITSDRPLTKFDKLVEQDGKIGWLYKSKIDTLPKTGYGIRGTDGNKYGVYFGKTGIFKDAITTSGSAEKDSNFFTHFKLGNPYSSNGDIAWLYVNKPGTTDLRVRFADESINTVELFEKYMADKDIKILYETAQTEFIPLPQSEQNAIRALKTYYPTTVITVDGGELDPDIKVTYRKEI